MCSSLCVTLSERKLTHEKWHGGCLAKIFLKNSHVFIVSVVFINNYFLES